VTDHVTCTIVIDGNNNIIFAVTPTEVAGINVGSGNSIHNKEEFLLIAKKLKEALMTDERLPC